MTWADAGFAFVVFVLMPFSWVLMWAFVRWVNSRLD